MSKDLRDSASGMFGDRKDKRSQIEVAGSPTPNDEDGDGDGRPNNIDLDSVKPISITPMQPFEELGGLRIYNPGTIVGGFGIIGTGTTVSRVPKVGGGAKLENIAPGDARRIQNAADRTGVTITVVGSRAKGTAHGQSDWDYVLEGGTARSRHSSKSSIPSGPHGLGEPRVQDFFSTLDQSQPYISFSPKKE